MYVNHLGDYDYPLVLPLILAAVFVPRARVVASACVAGRLADRTG